MHITSPFDRAGEALEVLEGALADLVPLRRPPEVPGIEQCFPVSAHRLMSFFDRESRRRMDPGLAARTRTLSSM